MTTAAFPSSPTFSCAGSSTPPRSCDSAAWPRAGPIQRTTATAFGHLGGRHRTARAGEPQRLSEVPRAGDRAGGHGLSGSGPRRLDARLRCELRVASRQRALSAGGITLRVSCPGGGVPGRRVRHRPRGKGRTLTMRTAAVDAEGGWAGLLLGVPRSARKQLARGRSLRARSPALWPTRPPTPPAAPAPCGCSCDVRGQYLRCMARDTGSSERRRAVRLQPRAPPPCPGTADGPPARRAGRRQPHPPLRGGRAGARAGAASAGWASR